MRGKQSAWLLDKRINGRPKSLPKGNIHPVRIKADLPQYPAESHRPFARNRSNSAEPAFRRPWGILRPSEKSSCPTKDKTMSDISNFARHNAVSVVEFADYLRECRPYNGPKRKQNEIHGGSGCLTVWW